MSAPADEAWKVIICARDIKQAEDALATIEYLAAGGFSGRNERSAKLAFIRSLSGAEIADAIERHIQDRLASVQAAIRRDT